MKSFLSASLVAAFAPLLVHSHCNTAAVPTYAPVPPGGVGPKIPSTGYRVEFLTGGAYMVTDGIYQSLFFVTKQSVVAVDAPPTIGPNILKAIRSVTNLPISHMVYSHSHEDHIGSAYLLAGPETTIVAQKETVTQLAVAVDDHHRPLPNVTFTDSYTLTVGNQTLHLSYKGVNHEPGNIFIYAPKQKILMLVDVIYPGWEPYARLAESQNIPNWIKAHDQVLEYDFTYYVGGHLNRYGTRRDVLVQKEFVNDLYNNCAQAIRMNANNASVAAVEKANPNNSWAIDLYINNFRVEYCNNKTNEKWLSRLAGVDVYGKVNAETMLESVKIDFGVA